MTDYTHTPAPKFDTSGPSKIAVSSEATQASTFTPEDNASLSNVQRAGVSQTQGNTYMKVEASNKQDFSEEPNLMDSAGRTIHDLSKAKDSDRLQIGDQSVTLGNARNLGWVKTVNGSLQLTETGQEFMVSRAGSTLKGLEADELQSFHSPNSAAAMGKLDAITGGKFTSFLPAALAAHMAGKPIDHDMLQFVSEKSGLEQDFVRGLISEISQESLDNGSREIGRLEGLSGAQVFQLVKECSQNTQRLYLTACAMGDKKAARDIVKAIRRKDIK